MTEIEEDEDLAGAVLNADALVRVRTFVKKPTLIFCSLAMDTMSTSSPRHRQTQSIRLCRVCSRLDHWSMAKTTYAELHMRC